MKKNTASAQRSANMRAIKARDTGPELIVRCLVHRLGFRFRLRGADLPGKPDLVFPGRNAVIFVHGCFWHRHHCKRGRSIPRTNATFWADKLARNARRDRSQLRTLRRRGWRVMIVWECELKNCDVVSRRIVVFLRSSGNIHSRARLPQTSKRTMISTPKKIGRGPKGMGPKL
jgi:DNA mismatch endonuclease (patch repair protein)